MIFDDINQQLLVEIQHGLPIASRPYAVVGEKLGLSEQEVIARLAQLQSYGLIKRLGVIVKHRKLGYQANAMVVWDIPDEQVQHLGQQLSQFDFVNLCYRRPRQGTAWPYNLFCMIHGKSREIVLQQIEVLKQACQLQQFPQQILFSRRCFKQRGAVYAAGTQELSHG